MVLSRVTMRLLIAFLVPIAGWAADFTAAANFRVHATPRSAVISYVVPQGAAACTWEVSESSALTPLVHDLDTALFPNSNRDDRAGSQSRGSARSFVLGQGGTGIDYAPVASDGIRYSRALQAFTQHYGRVTCGSDTATVSFRTANLEGDPTLADVPFDPAGPAGEPAWPYLDQTNRAATVIDPQTGVLLKRLTFPRQETVGGLGGVTTFNRAYNASTNWTNPNNALNTSGAGATCGGACAASQSILFLNYDYNPPDRPIDLVNALPTCGVTGSPTGDDGKVEIALTIDQTNPYGKWIPSAACAATIGAATEQKIGDDPAHAAPGLIAAYLAAWLNPGQSPPQIPDTLVHNFVVNTSSTGNTVVGTSGGSAFPVIPVGATIILGGNPFIVATYTDGFHLTVTTNPGNNTGLAGSFSGFGVLVRKRTTSSNTIELRAQIGVGQSILNQLDGGGGQSVLCSNKLRSDGLGKQGYHCGTSMGNSNWNLWWIAPIDGEVRHLGILGSNGTGGSVQGCNESSLPFDTATDASFDYLYCLIVPNSGLAPSPTNKPLILKMKLDMANTDLGPIEGGNFAPMTQSVLLSDIPTAVHALRPDYDANLYVGWDMVGLHNGKIVVKSGSQEGLAWLALIDQTTGAVSAAINTWSSPGFRWCGIHTAFDQGNSDLYIGGTFLRSEATEATSGYFLTHSTTSLSTSLSSCEALAPGHPFGTLGATCSSVTFNTNTPASPFSGFTVAGQQWARGDTVQISDAALVGGQTTGTEMVRLIANTSGTTWVIQRGFSSDHVVVPHSSGANFYAWCSCIPYDSYPFGASLSAYAWWDSVSDPTAANTNDPYGQNLSNATIYKDVALSVGSHSTNSAIGSIDLTIADACDTIDAEACPILSPFNTPAAIRTGTVKSPTANYIIGSNTPFGNPTLATSYGLCYGDACEHHPSKVKCDHSSPNECELAFNDVNPWNLGNVDLQTTALVGGMTNIFKITGLEPAWPMDQKRQRLGYQIGHHVVKDISGPASIITDGSGGFYTGCQAYVANECLSGSTAGDIYVNVPFPTPWPTGTSLAGTYACFDKGLGGIIPANYPCVAELGSVSDFAMQYVFTGANEPYGFANRRITKGLIPPAGGNFTGNGRSLADGSWMFFNVELIQNRTETILAKLPPLPGSSSINRTDFIPIVLTRGSVPPGTDNAIVRFGYSPSFNCTRRQEACIANAGGIQTGAGVLSFEGTDSYNGVSCASGCVVTIPALGQRVMWYQWVFRNVTNGIIGTAPIEVLATP